MRLPQAIQAYFEADRNNDSEGILRCFAPDAIVRDEARTHSGRVAIASWWEHSKASYRYVAEPLEAAHQDRFTKVRARVTGEFPGSPAMLTFSFNLAGQKIASLEIEA